jgi:hypothetical protein
MTYRIRDWNRLYETHETRKLVRLTWLPTPIKHDGNGYRRLMSLDPDGSLFAAFRLAVEVAGKCSKRGTLADEHGPLTPDDLAFKTGLKAEHFGRMLEVCRLSQYKICWIDTTDEAENLPESPGTPGESGTQRDIPESPGGPPGSPAMPGESPGRINKNNIDKNNTGTKAKAVPISDNLIQRAFTVTGGTPCDLSDQVRMHGEPEVNAALVATADAGKKGVQAWPYAKAILKRRASEGYPAETTPGKRLSTEPKGPRPVMTEAQARKRDEALKNKGAKP